MPFGETRILVVDDDETDYLLVRHLLLRTRVPGRRVLPEWAGSYEAGLAAALGNRHDVCLVDYRLGERTGLDLIRAAAAGGSAAPMILLTGQGDRAVDLEAARAGADDYLPKDDLGPEVLERAIRYAIRRRRSEAALRQAQKMEAVGRLAAGVARELGVVAAAVTEFSAEALSRLPSGDPAREGAERARRSGERCAALTHQLLAIGQTRSASEVCDLNSLIDKVMRALRPAAGDRTAVNTALDPTVGPVRADPARVEQVLAILAANAVEAMPRGGTLSVRTRNADPDGSAAHHPDLRIGWYVEVEVTDNGEGMSAEVKARLFEPFFTTKGDGRGLGLTAVYGAVVGCGGRVVVDSEPGRGTTVRIFLPRAEGPTAVSGCHGEVHPGGDCEEGNPR